MKSSMLIRGLVIGVLLIGFNQKSANAQTTNLGKDASFGFQVSENLVAFTVFEPQQGNTDLNGDGDTTDFVLHVYDPTTGITTNLGKASGEFLIKDSLDNAALVFRSGRVRYPKDTRFLLEIAHVHVSKGDDESAYEVMADYIKLADQDPTHYWNLGLLARFTGRLDEAVAVLQKALSRERDRTVIRKLHFLLYDAKRRQGAPAKDLLKHVVSFGELTDGDPDEEARFLIMALLTPSGEQDFDDAEVREWKQKITARLETFVTAHPKSKVFRRLTIPEGLPEESQGLYFLAEVIALQLPHRLATTQIELAARGQPWPLVFRKKYLGKGQSICDYWAF